MFLAKATSHNNRLEKKERNQYEKHNAIITNWAADKRNDRVKDTSFTWWKFRESEFVTNIEQMKRPHHKQGLSCPSHWKFPPPAISNLLSHLKRSYKIPSSRSAWMELRGAWPKWRPGALHNYKIVLPFCPVYLKFPAITPAWIQANTASAAFYQPNWQGQNF